MRLEYHAVWINSLRSACDGIEGAAVSDDEACTCYLRHASTFNACIRQ